MFGQFSLHLYTFAFADWPTYSRVIDVSVVVYSIHSVLVELARCMELFPSLRTVALDSQTDQRDRRNITWESPATKAFGRHVYPQISNVILSPPFQPFLGSCPNVLSAKGVERYYWQQSIPLDLLAHYAHLERIYLPPQSDLSGMFDILRLKAA